MARLLGGSVIVEDVDFRVLAYLRVINEAQPDGEDPPLPAQRKGEKPQECAQDHKPDGPGKESDIAHRIHHPG